jgi:hypothetical protein
MASPRLKEEETLAVQEDAPHSEVVRNLLAWVHDLLAERAPPDTSIPWEDGEDRSAEAPDP